MGFTRSGHAPVLHSLDYESLAVNLDCNTMTFEPGLDFSCGTISLPGRHFTPHTSHFTRLRLLLLGPQVCHFALNTQHVTSNTGRATYSALHTQHFTRSASHSALHTGLRYAGLFRWAESEEAYKQAVSLRPAHAPSWASLGDDQEELLLTTLTLTLALILTLSLALTLTLTLTLTQVTLRRSSCRPPRPS